MNHSLFTLEISDQRIQIVHIRPRRLDVRRRWNLLWAARDGRNLMAALRRFTQQFRSHKPSRTHNCDTCS